MPILKDPKIKDFEMNVTEAFEFATFNEQEVERTGSSHYSYWRSTLQAFKKRKLAMFLLCLVALILLFTFIQPYLPNQYDPFLVNNNAKGLPNKNQQPGAQFWLGTNSIGQDLWARLWSGTRTSLIIGISVAVLEAFVGILIGVLWGYVRKLDFLFTELYNVLDNIPNTVVLILVSFILRPGMWTIVFALSLTGWIGMARFVRNQIIIIRDRDYNVASRCLGTGTFRIILRNLLPYLVSVIMLRMALSIPGAIGSEVFVTYIGLGLPATIPSLGNLINAGRTLMMSPNLRYQLIYPTIILSIVTISFYVIGNAFSDSADPKNHL
jgi:ABC-type dipeptide/oligopeptide/nickel transport systems, permease components